MAAQLMGSLIGWFVGALVRGGLSQRVARGVAHAAVAIVLATVLGLCVALAVKKHDRGVIAGERARQDAAASSAREISAGERAADAIVQTRQEEKAHAIVDQARDDGPPSAAAVALGCERLRRAGWKELPEPCRRGGGDRGQTAADR
jgi:anti-sigma factor ChrR (cupin superfamily)